MASAEGGPAGDIAWKVHSAASRAEVVFLLGERRDALQVTVALFGRRLRRWEFAGLAGAPDDARVEVGTLAGDLYLEMHHESMQRNGLGLRIFCRQTCQAKALGVRRIEVTAGRGRAENGYYTWPRFGMDGPLPATVTEMLPPGLRSARSVLDLIQSEPGRWWWKAHGCRVDLAFDLSEGSRCWRVFQAYLRSRLGTGCRDGGNRPAAIE